MQQSDEEHHHDQMPAPDEVKTSRAGQKIEGAHDRRGMLQRTACVFFAVMVAGFLMGYIGMTVLIVNQQSTTTSAPNMQTEPPTLESRLEATLGVKTTEIFLDGSTDGYQSMAIEHMKQHETTYANYADEKLKQVYGLLCLYYATNDSGNGWSRARSWQVDHNECQWEGIRCNALDQVVEIDLTYFGLDGAIPFEITLIKTVFILRLDNNPELTGRIPAFLGQMPLLQLSVTGCGYVGDMPQEICDLKESNPAFVVTVECPLVQCNAFCCNC